MKIGRVPLARCTLVAAFLLAAMLGAGQGCDGGSVVAGRARAAEKPPADERVAPGDYLSPLERDVLVAMNRLRADPALFSKDLEGLRPYFDGDLLRLPGRIPLMTNEGRPALEEAISALAGWPGRPPALRASRGMSKAAADHARDLGESGKTEHTGRDGSDISERLNRHGKWDKAAGENLAFGDNPGTMVVIQLLVDDGVPSRGHRRNLLEPDFRVTGIACGPHPRYRQACVIDFAGAYTEGEP